jgi:hypothetical protein
MWISKTAWPVADIKTKTTAQQKQQYRYPQAFACELIRFLFSHVAAFSLSPIKILL